MDLARGISVVLIVLLHVEVALVRTQGTIPTFWGEVSQVLSPLRIPTFFFVSGLLAQMLLRDPHRARRRLLTLAYLFVLWRGLLVVAQQSVPSGGSLPTITFFLLPATGYWYLYASGIFLAIALLTRRLPGLAVVSIGTTVALLNPQVLLPLIARGYEAVDAPEPLAIRLMLASMVFFLAGIRFPQLAGLLRHARWRWVIPSWLALTYLGWLRMEALTPTSPAWTWLLTVLGIPWVATLCATAFLLAERRGPQRFARVVGVRTLPIYLVQFPLLVLLAPHIPRPADPLWQLLAPPLWTVAFVLAGLGAYWLAQRLGPAQYLFRLPYVRERR